MIRQATRQDKQQIIDMMKLFRSESNIDQYQGLNNEPYWHSLLDTILAGAGIVYIEDDVGLIMALITPTVWCNKTLFMQELAWYVIPSKRHTSTGYRLLRKYVDYGNKLKQEGRIVMFGITKMITSPDIKYSKFGFSKLEENWIQ